MFDTSDFPARWGCGNWGPIEGWTHIASDITIAASYIAIPSALLLLVRRRKDIVFPWIVWLFIAFILSCGITHAFESSMFWWPAYRVTAVLKAVTAVVSVITAIALIRALPMAISLPSINRERNELANRMERLERANRDVEVARADVERRISELAVRERRLRDAVGSAKACAVMWDVDTGKVLWESGYGQMLRSAEVDGFADTLTWERLIGVDAAGSLRAASVDAWERRRVMHLRFGMLGKEGEWDIRMTATPEPAVAGQPRMILGLVGMVPYKDSMAPRE